MSCLSRWRVSNRTSEWSHSPQWSVRISCSSPPPCCRPSVRTTPHNFPFCPCFLFRRDPLLPRPNLGGGRAHHHWPVLLSSLLGGLPCQGGGDRQKMKKNPTGLFTHSLTPSIKATQLANTFPIACTHEHNYTPQPPHHCNQQRLDRGSNKGGGVVSVECVAAPHSPTLREGPKVV